MTVRGNPGPRGLPTPEHTGLKLGNKTVIGMKRAVETGKDICHTSVPLSYLFIYLFIYLTSRAVHAPIICFEM